MHLSCILREHALATEGSALPKARSFISFRMQFVQDAILSDAHYPLIYDMLKRDIKNHH
jgi:hypothetical protein